MLLTQNLSRISARTMTLSLAHSELSPREAQKVTGRSSSTLYLRAEEGEIKTTQKPNGHRRFDTASLVRYVRRQGEPVTLYDLLHDAAGHGVRLGLDAWAADEAATRAHPDITGPCYRTYRRDYTAPATPAWAAWYQGDTERAEAMLHQQRPRWEDERHHLTEQGLALRHLWVPRMPLTPYGRYLMAAHTQRAGAGHTVRVVRAARLRFLEQHQPLPELTVYGGRVVYLRVFTRLGRLDGALRIDSPGLAEALTRHLESLFTQADPLDRFRRGLPGQP
jgi:hypothetical protein